MMSQRFTLFYAGFTAYAPALYFNNLDLIDSLYNEENEAIKEQVFKLSDELKDKAYEYSTHINTAISVARHLEIDVKAQPHTFDEYFYWLGHFTECFEQKFPMARIDHYYFLFARKIAEIQSNFGLLNTYIDLTLCLKDAYSFTRKMDKCLKDTEFILFKLMAAAALLSSEPRQNYFNVYYRLLCQEFEPFKEVDVSVMGEKELHQLKTDIQKFDVSVTDGFKKCIGLLKELGV